MGYKYKLIGQYKINDQNILQHPKFKKVDNMHFGLFSRNAEKPYIECPLTFERFYYQKKWQNGVYTI